MLKLEAPEVRMAMPMSRAPDPAALAAYWAEYEDLCHQISSTLHDDDENLYEEGELETEWLQAAGLGSLAAPFQAGLEVSEAQLGEAVRPLPREQAAAVRRRVRRLNRTVRRKRAASRARKPDIRDVFRDLENSSGSEPRSRSATPDSLDSLPSGGSGSPPAEWADNATPPDFVDSFPPAGTHAPLARTPSAPAAPRRSRLSPPAPDHSPPLPMHELFKPNDLHWADIATNTEGIELLGYQRYGTVQGPRIGKERINGSILKDNELFINHKHTSVSRTKSAVSQQPLSFEHKFNLDKQMLNRDEDWPEEDSTADIESLSEPQLKRLPPLLWLELTALFDKYSLPFQKRKPPKKKRKEEGSVFGVSLETLVRKDMILWEETWSCVPSIFRAIASELRDRTCDEGLFRISGNKHRIAALCQLIERQWYSQRGAVEGALRAASGHDLAAVYKRLLRALPTPLLSQELMRLFYHTYALSGPTQGRALNLLILLLPAEQRATLREFVRLGRDVAARCDINKMSEHNVAMIIAPTLFPPSLLIKQSDSLETQLATAANSCHVTEALMRWSEQLWTVPASLHAASQRKLPQRRSHHT